MASRIGAVGGDIVAINILERDGGQAVDEFVIEIGGHHLIELLQSEIHEVDGVIRPRDPGGGLYDAGGLTT